MNDLNELVGNTVNVLTEDNQIKCIVKSVSIEDYYFNDKNEPIYISLSVEPINKLPKGFDDYEYLMDVPLSQIRIA
jgi:hypothetical protein